MDDVKYCLWCKTPIKRGCNYVSTFDDGDFCSYDCFCDYAWDRLEAEEVWDGFEDDEKEQ